VVANNIVSGPLNAGGENVTARDNFVFGGANTAFSVDYFKDPDRLDFNLLDNERTRSGLVNRENGFPIMFHPA
jgi:hypothetical protein